MPIDFTSALNTEGSAIERPPLLPPGHYVWAVEKIPVHDQSNKDFDFLDFPLKLIRPMDDVDADAIAEFGKLDNVRQRHRFIFDKNDDANFKRSLYNVKRFLVEHLQVDGVEKAPLKQSLQASVNHQCVGQIKWTKDRNDDELYYANIAKTAPVT